MKLYICWGTFPAPWRPGGHPCRNAYKALKEAGHDPELVKSYSVAPLPDMTSGRKEVKELTGQSWVPVLVLDDGEVVADSKNIVAWAKQHPASSPAGAAAS